MKHWYLYLAQCSDNSLYTGITTDLKRREFEHNTDNKLGAKSLRGKRPVKIVYYELYLTQSDARKREAQIKKWNSAYKRKLIDQQI